MIKLVAFDWNGTLIADMQTVLEADNEVLKILGKKPVTMKILREAFEVPIVNYYKNLGHSEKEFLKNAKLIAKTFHENYEKRVTKCRTRSHTKTLAEWLDKNQIISVIFSNHVTERIDEQLSRLKISHFFSQILANKHTGLALRSRTKGEKLREYILQNKLKYKEVLIVGDGMEEVEIAKNLGSISVAITDGNHSTRRLKAAKPDYLISDLGQIINIVKKINSLTN